MASNRMSFLKFHRFFSLYKLRLLIVLLTIVVTNLLIAYYPVSPRWIAFSLLERGGSNWITVDASQSRWLELALKDQENVPDFKTEDWQILEQGLETTTVDVVHDQITVDRIFVLRIDPTIFKFSVHVAPESYRDGDEWIDALKATAIINGSYYADGGYPLTPLKTTKQMYGPSKYNATHGAFIISENSTEIVDLKNISWKPALENSLSGFISYPMLLANGSEVRAKGHDDWLANRSFLAKDKQGRILMATTSTGYFSLRRLGNFLKSLPFEITNALNLDGGPVASMAVNSGNLRRTYYGQYELITNDNKPILLQPGNEGKKWSLPIVVAVHKR